MRWLRRRRSRDLANPATHLHMCRECGEGFVHPVTWTDSGSDSWWLLLRCGACDSWRDVVAADEDVAAFDRILDAGIDSIRDEAERLERELMRTDAEVLAKALRMDLLGAEDFRLAR